MNAQDAVKKIMQIADDHFAVHGTVPPAMLSFWHRDGGTKLVLSDIETVADCLVPYPMIKPASFDAWLHNTIDEGAVVVGYVGAGWAVVGVQKVPCVGTIVIAQDKIAVARSFVSRRQLKWSVEFFDELGEYSGVKLDYSKHVTHLRACTN